MRLARSGGLRLAVAGRQFTLTTRTSLPQGKWHEPPETDKSGPADRSRAIGRGLLATRPAVDIRRRVTVESDHVDVADTLTNRTSELIGVLYENRLQYAEKPREVRLAGRLVTGESANGSRCRASLRRLRLGRT